MQSPPPPGPASGGASGAFATTRWSLVALAAGGARPEARAALEELCAAYWYPVYALVRRRGRSPEDAADLTQAFFARLLERGDLARADAERGRFRAWLRGCVAHFLANDWDRQQAQKRGGGRAPLALDAEDAEGRWRAHPAPGDDPERAFERAWALTLLERVLARLAAEQAAAGRERAFAAFRPFLTGEPDASSQRRLAEELGASEGSVKVALHRLRRRFGELLRLEIAQTVDGPDEVEDELRGLFDAVAAPASQSR